MGTKRLKKTKTRLHKSTAVPTSTQSSNKNVVPKSKRDGDKNQQAALWAQCPINLSIFFVLVLATMVFYSGDLQLGFFSVDDPGYVTNNEWIKNVSADNIRHILSTPYFANYSPVHLFSYMFDYAVAGENAYAFHLSNNIWAGVTAGFVYLTGLAFTRNRTASLIAAVFFIVHPVHVEAVAWISSRKDLVATALALPSLLAFIRYRQTREHKNRWYLVSLLLFSLAVGGKLSVATFPAVFFMWDLFVEKISLRDSLLNKIPYLVVGLVVAALAASAQPSMGNTPDLFVILAALLENFWLLTGFASYVIYRVPPDPASTLLETSSGILLLAIFAAPCLLRRSAPKVTVLIYWVLLAFIPTQVLSFSHPVTDRYLYFPTVAAMILIGRGLSILTGKFGKAGLASSICVSAILLFLWGRTALNYLEEWNDPRSVWYAARSKSSDPIVYENLGSYYLSKVDQITAFPTSKRTPDDKLRQLVPAIWSGDAQASKLLQQWNRKQHGTKEETLFSDTLRSLAWKAFEAALQRKGNKILPGVYYNQGLILLNGGDLDAAQKKFLLALQEASKEPFAQVRQQISVYCHVNLAIIAWKKTNYQEALKWFKIAEEEQNEYGSVWYPAASENRRRLEQIVGTQSAH